MSDPFDQMAEDLLDSELAKDGLYCRPGRSAQSVKVIIRRGVEVVDESQQYTRVAMATLKSGAIEPVSGAKLQVDGKDWVLDHIDPDSDNGYTMRVGIRPA